MEQIFVQTMLHPDGIKLAKKKGIIGREDRMPLLYQVPRYSDICMTYTSHITGGYPHSYGHEGIIFTTEEPIVYASPVDAWHYMRGGNWLPGHERFLFNTLEEMLKKYPTVRDFKRDFREFFHNLGPEEAYPSNDIRDAVKFYSNDYVLGGLWLGKPECNEITFRAPLKINFIEEFHNEEELKKMLGKLR